MAYFLSHKRKKNMENGKEKLGVALVGLGRYSEVLASALQETKHCRLSGVVSGTESKREKWKSKYELADQNIYHYENFDSIKDNQAIDIIYVVLPNSMHAEYVLRAAAAGKHVVCEKPMAVTVEECDRMIGACKAAGVMLSIGYRLHFEPHNLEMIKLARQKRYGVINTIEAAHSLSNPTGWRLEKKLAGGGPLMDVGIYCVQAARNITGMEPLAVEAYEGRKKDQEKFKTIEESLTWRMEFPNDIIADCSSSYSKAENYLKVEAEHGWFELSPAFSYDGIKGETSDGKMELPRVNQQANQIDDFALAILNNRPTPVPGEMGRQDVKILQAIYRSMETGERVEIENETMALH
jgi:predicted dehydrogenase